MKNFIFSLCLAFSTLVSFTVLAQQELQQDSQQESLQFSKAELAQMLAPIALYPDSLLTHILIASTYPIEIVEAHRWLTKNDKLSSAQAAEAVKDFDWDASVKALVAFERILTRLSEDLSWTQQLGDAFLQDEARLLESIQSLREQAKLAGNLDKMDNMEVTYEKSNIIIEPREKEIVYVPYYDTRIVYGNWHWSSYPPVYWPPRHSIYVSHHSPFHWHSGIHISFNYFFSAFHWHNRHIVVVNPHRSHYRYYHQRPRRLVAHGGYAKRWAHKPVHRKGVAYRTKRTSQKYHSNRVSTHKANKQQHLTQQKKAQQRKAQQKKAQRQFNQRLSEKSQASSHKRRNNTQNKGPQKAVPKKYSPSNKPKEFRAQKGYRPKSSLNKTSPAKVTPKSYKNNDNKQRAQSVSSPKRVRQQKPNQQQRRQNASVTKKHSEAKKARHN